MKRKIIIISTILYIFLISCNQENNIPKTSIESVDSISKINTEKSEKDSLDDLFKEFAPIQGRWQIFDYVPIRGNRYKKKLDSNLFLNINKNRLFIQKNNEIVDSSTLFFDTSYSKNYIYLKGNKYRYFIHYPKEDIIVYYPRGQDGAVENYKRVNNDSLNINNSNVIENKKSIDSLNFPTEYDYKDAYASHYKYYINKAFSKEIFNKYYKEYQSKKLDSLIKVYEKNKTNTLN